MNFFFISPATGCQYRRINTPIGVPGPTLVNLSFSLTLSIALSLTL